MVNTTLITSLLLLGGGVSALRILCVFPIALYSHHSIGYALMNELAKRGHNVTFVTPFEENEHHENLRMVVLKSLLKKWKEFIGAQTHLILSYQHAIFTLFFVGEIGRHTVEVTLAHEDFQKLLHSGEEFDIVFVEQFVIEGLLVIAHRLGVPSATISALGQTIRSNHILGNPQRPSYMTTAYIESPIHTSFSKRVYNFLFYCMVMIQAHFYIYPAQNRIIQKYFPNSPHIYDFMYNTSLMLINSDASFHPALPKAPNMVEIGGFHVQPPKKLSGDLQGVLDSASDGAIYFSMGSILKGKYLPFAMREGILRSFSKLKEVVLWKFEEDLPNLPGNVIVKSWFPQQDILAHPNLKLFISHGGLQSIIEAVHRSVPIVGIPGTPEQRTNVARAIARGHGVMIPSLSELSEKTLTDAINEVLQNPKYAESIKRSSEILKDKQVSPIDKAEYWIEYVVRHKGAKHLRLPALDLTWYQHASLDVALFLMTVTIIWFYISYRIMRWLLGRKRSKKEKIH